MKRRGFLSFLGFSAGAAALPAMAKANEATFNFPNDAELGAWNDRGIDVSLKCGNAECGAVWRLFADLTKPLTFGAPQCPRCLHVMAWQIKAWNIAHGHQTTIYTPGKA